MGKDDIVMNTYKNTLKTKEGYSLQVQTVERHWKGDESGHMEGMPGTFIDVSVSLDNISKEKLDGIEMLAMDIINKNKKIVLYGRTKEITNEPKGYAKLYHDDFVEKIEAEPGMYINLQSTVKKFL